MGNPQPNIPIDILDIILPNDMEELLRTFEDHREFWIWIRVFIELISNIENLRDFINSHHDYGLGKTIICSMLRHYKHVLTIEQIYIISPLLI